MISPETTKEDLERQFDRFKHFVLPFIAAVGCILVTLLLTSFGLDRPLVTVLGAIWFGLFFYGFSQANRKSANDFHPLAPDSAIAQFLNPEFVRKVKVFACSNPQKMWWKVAGSGDEIVSFDASLLSTLPSRQAAKVIELSHRARIFRLASLIRSIYRGWIGTSIIALILCQDLLHFTIFVCAAALLSPVFLLLTLLFQIFYESPRMVKSREELENLKAAQLFLESQSLPILFPTSGWTKLKVLYSKQIVAHETRKYYESVTRAQSADQ